MQGSPLMERNDQNSFHVQTPYKRGQNKQSDILISYDTDIGIFLQRGIQ